MARINITLNQDEVFQLLDDDSGNAFRVILQQSLNTILLAESAEQLQALPYERSDKRIDQRNGTRTRQLLTRIGSIELVVPRHRDVPFKSLIFDNYKRSEAALITTMAEMVIAGVSTAKVGRVMEEICGKTFSKQTVSEACKELDDVVMSFCNRPINEKYLFVMADATYLKVRENHRVVAKALMIAIGLTPMGHKEVLGFYLADSETKETWEHFLSLLKKRGLDNMKMFTSDSHEGIRAALHNIYPYVPWQRCQAHFMRNIVDSAPKNLRQGLRSELIEMFNESTIKAARKRRHEIICDYKDKAPKAMECLDAGFDDAMTVMELPYDMQRPTRTSNYLERLNKEVKRRSNVIGIFPNADSIKRLIGSVLMEENESWKLRGRIYYQPACDELEARASKLIKIAEIQQKLLQAA